MAARFIAIVLCLDKVDADEKDNSDHSVKKYRLRADRADFLPNYELSLLVVRLRNAQSPDAIVAAQLQDRHADGVGEGIAG